VENEPLLPLQPIEACKWIFDELGVPAFKTVDSQYLNLLQFLHSIGPFPSLINNFVEITTNSQQAWFRTKQVDSFIDNFCGNKYIQVRYDYYTKFPVSVLAKIIRDCLTAKDVTWEEEYINTANKEKVTKLNELAGLGLIWVKRSGTETYKIIFPTFILHKIAVLVLQTVSDMTGVSLHAALTLLVTMINPQDGSQNVMDWKNFEVICLKLIAIRINLLADCITTKLSNIFPNCIQSSDGIINHEVTLVPVTYSVDDKVWLKKDRNNFNFLLDDSRAVKSNYLNTVYKSYGNNAHGDSRVILKATNGKYIIFVISNKLTSMNTTEKDAYLNFDKDIKEQSIQELSNIQNLASDWCDIIYVIITNKKIVDAQMKLWMNACKNFGLQSLLYCSENIADLYGNLYYLVSNDENVLNKLPLEAPSDTISTEKKEKQIKKKR